MASHTDSVCQGESPRAERGGIRLDRVHMVMEALMDVGMLTVLSFHSCWMGRIDVRAMHDFFLLSVFRFLSFLTDA